MVKLSFNNWGGLDPYKIAEDLAFANILFYQNEGSLEQYIVNN